MPNFSQHNDVVTADDLRFFEANGYLVVRDAVPDTLCRAVIGDIFRFLSMDPGDPKSWYTGGRRGGGMAHMHQLQSLWDVRQEPRVYDAFAAIYGTPNLWVSIDRAGMKPPDSAEFPEYEDRGFLHWDMDTRDLSQPFFVQGVVALTDTDESMGGFLCVPGFHGAALANWIPTQPDDRNPRAPDPDSLPAGLKVTPIPMRAGDLVIWDRTLAHGNGHNHSDRPRLAQYVTMFPARNDDSASDRVASWQNRVPPPGGWAEAVPPWLRGREAQMQDEPAHLTPLGRKLLGIDPWRLS